ncbi:MAG: hypothetical protein OXU35_08050 [Acidobacteriota bacterium]|nr:hypothetical protein [Acidobacteriota bacterium]
MKKLHLHLTPWVVAAGCALSLGCDNGDSTTTPLPATPLAPPLPPPTPEPADVAGDWVVRAEANPTPSIEPAEGCFHDEWWSRRTDLATADRQPDQVFRIEQDGTDLTGYAWDLEEGQEPAGLENDQAGWRIAGTADETEVVLAATERNIDGEWAAYPYVAFEVPAAVFLQGKCPEYGDQMLQAIAVSSAAEMTLQDDGSMTGTIVLVLEWRIGEGTWTETQGPTSLTATRLDE